MPTKKGVNYHTKNCLISNNQSDYCHSLNSGRKYARICYCRFIDNRGYRLSLVCYEKKSWILPS